MTSAILTALLALAPHHADRHLSDAERAAMLAPVAEAISAAARTPEEQAFLVAQGFHESAYSSAILRGECGRHQCDPGRDGKPQSTGAWQVKGRWCDVSTLTSQARCVLKLARGGRQRCQTGWLAAFAAQSGSVACNAKWAPKRVRLMRESLQRIHTARQAARTAVADAR